MRNIKLIIEYDGSHYHGWQYQDNALSIQEVLSGAIKRLTGENIIPDGSGRTDAGVHAYGQTASFRTASKIPAEKFSSALNSLLPWDISIISSEAVSEDFHARLSATGKHYRYMILNRPQRSAILDKKVWHVREKLDINAMQKAAQFFIGYHFFKAFCAAGHSVKTFEREIYKSKWSKQGDVLVFDTEGDGFLYNMVRIMVGTMVDIGKGRLKSEIIKKAIESGLRNDVGVTAPPTGLYLIEVYYGELF